ncbi:SRPBCC family protein [Streptomyces sp. SID486]|uniref:SRPBCC family protein n=1 Tax=unclassified Streptomyces TaxID=2593676 RepID=UPI0013685A46|nr:MULTISPECIES: SRPBCC family protein [unclassified Streptomyces]MYW15681.1 SRPBCC family protein [Streptomyces sp. SID2955]MYW44534.1 SRPBCC family protein [Streptomyces sp. SID161]MYX99435.1 SRPBCC family protein [Streptomyces sp. SID486]
MAEYERSRTMPAQPEQVFDQAADAGRLDAWLPGALHVDVGDPPAVTVHEDRTGHDTAALLRSEPDQMRMEWGTREHGGYTGWLQVAGIGSGTSEVTVHLSFFDDSHDPGEQAVRDALDGSLRRLEDQVRTRSGGATADGGDDTAG